MTRGGRYYEQLNARRRREQFRGRLKAWLKLGALLAFMLILGSLVWEQNGKLDDIQRELNKVKKDVHDVQKRFGEADKIRRQIQDLQPDIPDGEALETAAAILSFCKKYKADPTIILAMANAESSFNRNARGTSGERGLLQILPSTFRRFGRGDLNDWKASLEAGIRYYSYLQRKYHGNIVLSVAAYNAGIGSVKDRIPDIPVTQRHVRKVMLAFRGMRR